MKDEEHQPDIVAIHKLHGQIVDVINAAPPMEVSDTIFAIGAAITEFILANTHVGTPDVILGDLIETVVDGMKFKMPKPSDTIN